jgi:hypothetical protein
MLISLSARCASAGEFRALAQIFHTAVARLVESHRIAEGEPIKAIPVAKFDNTLISRYFAARSVFFVIFG